MYHNTKKKIINDNVPKQKNILYKYKPKSKSVPIKKENTYEDLQKIDKFMDKIIENNKKDRTYKKT